MAVHSGIKPYAANFSHSLWSLILKNRVLWCETGQIAVHFMDKLKQSYTTLYIFIPNCKLRKTHITHVGSMQVRRLLNEKTL